MALWTAVQALPNQSQELVKNIYGPHFRIEVRNYLADWIEKNNWEWIDPENGNHENLAGNYLQLLLSEIQATSLRLNGIHFLHELPGCALQLQEKYSNNPLQLVRVIRQCLEIEKQILQTENISESVNNDVGTDHNLPSKFEALKRITHETEAHIREMHQEQEVVNLEVQKTSILKVRLQQIQEQVAHQQQIDSTTTELITKLKHKKTEIDQNLTGKLKCLQIARMNFQDKFQETFRLISELYNRVIEEELKNWKILQKMAGNGYPFDDNLNQIEQLCELLVEILWQNCQQINQLIELQTHFRLPLLGVDQLPNLKFQFINLLSSLFKEIFVIEVQPAQVIKTNTKFCATPRLLVGKVLNVQMTRPQVKAQLINETQANEIIMNKIPTNKDGYFDVSSGELLNNTGTLEINEVRKHLSVNFTNLSLKNVKRSNKKAAEAVTDEKFSLLFQSIIKIGDGNFHVWTMSLPIVVIVHGSQESPAWATITWNNEFSEIVTSYSDLTCKKSCFAVPESVPWSRMAQVLSLKFQTIVGKGLHEQNLNYLASKIFNGPITHDYLNMPLSWAQFCKDDLPNRNFTFWNWFYAIMKLTREHLQGPWNDGLIIGFVDRNEAENMLQTQSGGQGTFLLRFSDSELGGVTAACLHMDQITEFKQVLMLEPFTAKKLCIRSLADSLNDIKALHYLFPNIPKDVAFSKYYTTSNDITKSENGYRKLIFVAKILGSDLYQEGHPALSQHLHELDINVEHAADWSNNDFLSMAMAESQLEEENSYYPSIPVNELVRILQTSTLPI